MHLFLVSRLWAEEPNWEDTIKKVSSAVVAIQISSVRYFDTEKPATGQATGFVIDKERGLILTNRHVVEPGPVSSRAILLNSEEIDLQPLYRDPVHDFGLYRYNPDDVEHMELEELELCVDCADVGLDVRLLGNDASEKLSILEATLARLDRNAPNYGRGKYNDFNTFYYQAAAGSSGGSSGSPVVNIQGQVVALNAGGSRKAASSFFLPLHRVSRAVELIKSDQSVTRGTLLGQFYYEPFEVLRRKGMRKESEDLFRQRDAQAQGGLILKQLTPQGPLDGLVEVGDVLVRVEGQLINQFFELEKVLDERVGETISVELDRRGEARTVELKVSDLHQSTPDRFVEACNGSFHNLSYQMARHYNLPIKGVFVASSGFCFGPVGRGSVILGINGKPIDTIEDFWSTLSELKDKERILVRSFAISKPKQLRTTQVEWDKKWFPNYLRKRNDQTGLWEIQDTFESPDADLEVIETKFGPSVKFWQRRRARSVVMVENQIPHRIEEVYGANFVGVGVVLDAKEGLVAIERDTVPISLGAAQIVFYGKDKLPADIVWIHPQHNIALLKYNPALLSKSPVRSINWAFQGKKPPMFARIVSFNRSREFTSGVLIGRETDAFYISIPRNPHFRETNLDLWQPDGSDPDLGGVVLTRWGRFHGMMVNFPDLSDDEQLRSQGVLRADLYKHSLELYRSNQDFASLGAELGKTSVYQARKLGYEDSMLEKRQRPEHFYYVARINPESPAAQVLQSDDLILQLNEKKMEKIMEIEEGLQEGSVSLKILRQGAVLDVSVEPMMLSGRGTEKVLLLGGSLMHDVHNAVSYQRGVSGAGVYIASCPYGSPCSADKLYWQRRIVSINGSQVNNIDQFAELLAQQDLTQPLRLTTLDLLDRPSSVALRLDEHYWPTAWLVREGSSWSYKDFEPQPQKSSEEKGE